MERIGLVLAGGGGKGSYQIGVWKYLEECGLAQHICAVSGTSVGALNAALFSAGNYQNAEHIWVNIAPEKILSPKKIEVNDILSFMAMAVGGTTLNRTLIATSFKELLQPQVAIAISKLLGKNYMFSRDGLIEIMENEVNFGQIQHSVVPCFATCFELSSVKPKSFELNRYSIDVMKNILLASSAIPVIFDKVDINGEYYVDGGLPLIGDNVPIKPLYDLGIENIIVVHLDQNIVIDKSKYINSRIIEIVPSQDLGGVIDGVLDFNSSGSIKRIELGYSDAKEVFGTFVETVKLGKINQFLLESYRKSEMNFQNRKMEIQNHRDVLHNQRNTDGFDKMCKDLGLLN